MLSGEVRGRSCQLPFVSSSEAGKYFLSMIQRFIYWWHQWVISTLDCVNLYCCSRFKSSYTLNLIIWGSSVDQPLAYIYICTTWIRKRNIWLRRGIKVDFWQYAAAVRSLLFPLFFKHYYPRWRNIKLKKSEYACPSIVTLISVRLITWNQVPI